MAWKFNPFTGKLDYVNETVGTPSDGTFTDGLFPWPSSTLVSDALDDLNEAMADLAPPQPLAMNDPSNILVESGLAQKVTGRMSQKTGQNYPPGMAAGDLVSYIIRDPVFQLDVVTVAPTNSGDPADDAFSDGDAGDLIARINGADAATILDLGSQTPPVTSGVLTFSARETYNNFNKWQRGHAYLSLDATALRSGYNEIFLRHVVNAINRDSPTREYFFDTGAYNNSNDPDIDAAPTVTEQTVVDKYLSGIRHYGAGSTFLVALTVTPNVPTGTRGLFEDTYRDDPLGTLRPYSGGWFPTTYLNLADGFTGVPSYNSTYNVTGKQITVSSTGLSIDARVRVYIHTPYATNVDNKVSASENRLVCGYGNVATDRVEEFRDEYYRQPTNETFDVDVALTGRWTSTTPLVNGEAQVFNDRLHYPQENFETGYLPAQPNGTRNVDYSTFTGAQVYKRVFRAPNTRQSGTLKITFASTPTSTEVDPYGTGELNVRLKLMSVSAWADLGSWFDASDPPQAKGGTDNKGCKVSATVVGTRLDLEWSMGSLTDDDLAIEVTYRTKTGLKEITRIEDAD